MNPKYFTDDTIGEFDIEFLGIDIWQVKSGTIFDDFLITDDVAYAEQLAKKFKEKQSIEGKVKEETEERNRKTREEELKKVNEERAKEKEYDDFVEENNRNPIEKVEL